jgi:3-oxoacyl-[acyl-carrier-protein] synthase III
MTVIISYATNLDTDTGSYIEHAARAAGECLVGAAVAPEDIGVLINVGVYRDHNIVEPSIAALIQNRLGIGLEYDGCGHPLSFDLMNGACGLLYAISVAESLFATGDIDYVLVTAGEAHPSTQQTFPGFPYRPAAAALLLGHSDHAGFGPLHTAYAGGPVEPAGCVSLREAGPHGRNSVQVIHSDDPLPYAVRSVRSWAAASGSDVGDLPIITPSPTADFGDRLAVTLGIDRALVRTAAADVGDTHSAATIFAAGAAAATEPSLWLVAGGPSAACMAYHV